MADTFFRLSRYVGAVKAIVIKVENERTLASEWKTVELDEASDEHYV